MGGYQNPYEQYIQNYAMSKESGASPADYNKNSYGGVAPGPPGILKFLFNHRLNFIK